MAETNSRSLFKGEEVRKLAKVDYLEISMIGDQYVRQGREQFLESNKASYAMTKILTSNIDLLADETKSTITSGSVKVQQFQIPKTSILLPIVIYPRARTIGLL